MAQYPLKHLTARSFGPFEYIDIDLADGLNLIVGDNATGKSQLLKILYACTRTLKDADKLTKKELSGDLASKLSGTFRPESLGRLTRRKRGTAQAEVTLKYEGIGDPLSFTFNSRSRSEVVLDSLPHRELDDEPVFLPSHELLSLAARFIGLYDAYETGFEETWRDTVELLQRPALRGPRGSRANDVLRPFTDLLQGGSVVEEGGQFYLHQPGIGNLEAPLVAEGHRKLAMVARLISSGVLLEGGYLFWDEPEANLNPASQRAVARALVELARSGAQIFVATHSMFLLRELQMSAGEISPQFIVLSRAISDPQEAAAQVIAETSHDLDTLAYVAALEAEAEQADRYLAW